MYVDSVTTAALVDEFRAKIVNGRVQAIVQTSPDSLGFEIYANQLRHYLFMTVHAETARCHLVPEKLRRGVDKPSPLFLQLRKYLDGARLTHVSQPEWERILWMDFTSTQGEFRLIIETMGRHSNIILTSEDQIFECIKRITAEQNRYRTILPGQPYVAPPSQDKILPDSLLPSTLTEAFKANEDEPAWRILVNLMAGISPQFAREIVYRSCGDEQAPAFDIAPDVLYPVFLSLINDVEQGNWSPCVIPAGDAGYRAFAAYNLTHFDEASQPVESISEAMTIYFGAAVGEDAYAQARSTVREQLDKALDRAGRKKNALARQEVDEEEIETLRKKGELIYAYASTLTPKQESFEAQYDVDGPPITIEIDPALTAVENAQQYFERYEKAKRARRDLPRLQARARHDYLYLTQLSTDLDMAESWPEIEMVREALQEAGYWQGKKAKGPKGGKPGIRRITTDDGFIILVARNAEQNHKLVTERSNPEDLWLHARDIPGSHVIIKNDGRTIPEDIIRRASQLAAYYSAGRGEASVDVILTERRYVRPIKGGRPGMVTYNNETTLAVKPQK